MQLNRLQISLIAGSLIVFFIMYFGCETKPQKVRELETSRALSMEVTSVQNIINEVRKDLTPDQLNVLETLQSQLERDTSKLPILEMLSRKWFEYGHASVAGHYAEELALIKKDEDSWSIAGTTYMYGLKSTVSEKEKDFCRTKAIKAIEHAISLNPSKVAYKINLALVYVEHPLKENPMLGILQLRELNTKYPENVNVINQLARLALKTNQIEKALERLNQALKLEPKNKTTNCLLSEAYEASGDQTNAELFKKKCLELN